jgi:FHS family L-fucose permease-like MFS transporter
MSIIGGAVLTAAMGFISDQSSIRIAMLVPLACFAVVSAFGHSDRHTAASAGRAAVRAI